MDNQCFAKHISYAAEQKSSRGQEGATPLRKWWGVHAPGQPVHFFVSSAKTHWLVVTNDICFDALKNSN
eukprot:scaffold332_cov117-Cylindrotheca_fusiformis.AAC.29